MYIEAGPRKDASASSTIANTFLDEFKQVHPVSEINVLNLYETEIPEFTGNTIDAKYQILHGLPHSAEQKEAWCKVEACINEFKMADLYVFSVPMWNFGVPYRLKHYLDVIVQPGYTFMYTPGEGYKGLVNEKPAILICSRGGAYGPDSEVDFQKSYMEHILKFIGFTDIRTILVEPTAVGPDQKDEVMNQARAKALSMAKDF